ncbi:MAG: DUF1330 domain-containing protein [Azospirillaceae bacterium]
MPAFLIADLRTTDPDKAVEYRKAVVPLVKKHGGVYRTRGGEVRTWEGDWRPERIVIIEFPSMAAAQAFYDDPEYGPVKQLRLDSADGAMILVEGLETPV